MGNACRIGDHHRVFGDGRNDAYDVCLLLAEGTQGFSRVSRGLGQGVLAGDEDAGQTVLPCRQNSRQGIGRGAACRHQTDARASRMLGIRSGGEGGGLLVVHAYRRHGLEPGNGIRQEQGAPAADQKDMAHALRPESFHHIVGNPGHGRLESSGRGGGRGVNCFRTSGTAITNSPAQASSPAT